MGGTSIGRPDGSLLYEESLSSPRTWGLFLGLCLIFLALAVWQGYAGNAVLAVVLGVLCLLFLFYVVNYRHLDIRLTPEALRLTFGIFKWQVPLDNIASCQIDALPPLLRCGGAGIHFFNSAGCYRASFNFLQYPRVLILLKRKAGLVQGISFSTRHPDQVIGAIQAAAEERPRT